jgi:hypothetical protein
MPLPTGRELLSGRTLSQFIDYVTELTCFIFYSAKPFNCSTTWNLTHRFSNEYSEPSLIERTRFSQLLVSSLDLTFVVSVTTLVSFLLIIRKPPNLHAPRNPAKDFLVLRALVECDLLIFLRQVVMSDNLSNPL